MICNLALQIWCHPLFFKRFIYLFLFYESPYLWTLLSSFQTRKVLKWWWITLDIVDIYIDILWRWRGGHHSSVVVLSSCCILLAAGGMLVIWASNPFQVDIESIQPQMHSAEGCQFTYWLVNLKHQSFFSPTASPALESQQMCSYLASLYVASFLCCGFF